MELKKRILARNTSEDELLTEKQKEKKKQLSKRFFLRMVNWQHAMTNT
jgi:hypothetical protein